VVRGSRSGTDLRLRWRRCNFLAAILVPGNQLIEVIAIGTVGAEILFVEETFDAAAWAYLVRMTLRPDRPAHTTVPAAAKDDNRSSRQPGGYQTQGPSPTELLLALTHLPQPVSTCLAEGYNNAGKRANEGSCPTPRRPRRLRLPLTPATGYFECTKDAVDGAQGNCCDSGQTTVS
jgi:hypothetical protein